MGKLISKFVLFLVLLTPGLAVQQMKWESLMLIKAAAEKGNAEAQFLFGMQVMAGDGIDRDRVEAEKWLRKAAEAGHAEAQQVLAKFYAKSDSENAPQSTDSDPAKTDMLVPAVVRTPESSAAQSHELDEDPAESVRWSLLLSSLRGADAFLVRGFLLENGIVVNRDLPAAAANYRKAADRGNARAQFRLGLMFAAGRGVAKDLVEASAWLSQAAANDSVEAADALAKLRALPAAERKEAAATATKESSGSAKQP